jgi:hypothetical protein
MGSYTKGIDFTGKKLVIWGKNATLDAAKKGRFFSSLDNDDHATTITSLALHELVLQNGTAPTVSLAAFAEKTSVPKFCCCMSGGGNYNRVVQFMLKVVLTWRFTHALFNRTTRAM